VSVVLSSLHEGSQWGARVKTPGMSRHKKAQPRRVQSDKGVSLPTEAKNAGGKKARKNDRSERGK